MQKFAVLSVMAFAVIGAVVFCAEVEQDEELDPFDMINFDHTNMRMRKKRSANREPELDWPPTEDQQRREENSSKEDKVTESGQGGEGTVLEKETAAKENSTPGSPPPGRGESRTASGGACPALSLFRQYVSRLLRFMGDKVLQMDADNLTEMCVRLHLTSHHVEMLENFKRDKGQDGVFSAHDILSEAVQDVHILNQDDHPSLRYLWVEKYFGVSLDKALQVMNFVATVMVLAVLLPRIRLTRLLCSCFWVSVAVSVAMTWNKLYKKEVAKQQDTFMRDLPAGCSKMADVDRGWWSALTSYITSQITFEKDACVEYYERLVTDPMVMVTPLEALSVAVVQTLLKPLRIVGTEISEFLRALLKDLPVQWQLVSLLLVFGTVVLVLFLTCGYRIRFPILTIEPSRSETKENALRDKIHQLQDTIQNMDAAKQAPPQLRKCDTVGSLPVTLPDGFATPTRSAMTQCPEVNSSGGVSVAPCSCTCEPSPPPARTDMRKVPESVGAMG